MYREYPNENDFEHPQRVGEGFVLSSDNVGVIDSMRASSD